MLHHGEDQFYSVPIRASARVEVHIHPLHVEAWHADWLIARQRRMKTLEASQLDRSDVSAAQLRTLAEGDYLTEAEPILLVGEAGTGKTPLAPGLCVAACR